VSAPRDVTELLDRIVSGDESATQKLLPLVYDELRALAGSFLSRERPDHTLQCTALVHEAYLRLVGQQVPWRSRDHFFAVAASAMRRILTDHARAHRAEKRGGGARRIKLEEPLAASQGEEVDLLDVHDALERLTALDPRKARVVELRFFAGLTNEEVAQVLNISRKTVVDDWTVARLWLRRELSRAAET